MSNSDNPDLRPTGMTLRDVRLYLSADGGSERDTDLYLEHNGIDLAKLSNEEIIPLDVCWRIFQEHAAIIGDEMHGVGRRRQKPGVTSLLIARMLLCDTLQEALKAYCAAVELIVPGLEVALTKRGESISLRWWFTEGEGEVQNIALESTAVVYFAIFSWLVDHQVPVLRVRGPEARNESGSTQLRALRAPVVYSGDDLEVWISLKAAQSRIIQDDLRLWQDGVYKLLCSAVLRPYEEDMVGQFTKQVRSALLQGLGQKQIAAQWGLSTKTIARRLLQEGYSFRRLRDEIRMEKAASLIHAGLSVEEIGYLVGYEDPRSFRRAFVRWFGLSPSVYRSHKKNS
ncbi:helix-turn-helix domain-containing protein [Kordiimonas sp.]|uniref:AraC family transcriptional regulator n=1 Tax=Kordiimonas sp. TaxID=1970157 RepID=UPI003A921FB9